MRRLFGMFRVLGLAALMLGAVTALTLHRAQAQLKESLSGLGQQIIQLDGFLPHSAPRKLFVNGLEFNVETVGTPLGVTDALNRFQGLCHSVGQVDLPVAVRQKLESGSTDSPLAGAGVIRQDADNEGYVGCLDVGAHLNGEGLLAHLVEFGKTQNLRSIGQLRYAMARRHEGTTTLVVLWTEGDTKLSEMFPKNADVPGRDLDGIPRPTEGRRLLSAFEHAMPYGIAAYRIEGLSKVTVLANYKAQLRQLGWKLHDVGSRLTQAEKDGRRVLLRVTEKRLGAVILTVSDLG